MSGNATNQPPKMSAHAYYAKVAPLWMGIVEHSVCPFCVMREEGRVEVWKTFTCSPSIPPSNSLPTHVPQTVHALFKLNLEQVRENRFVGTVCMSAAFPAKIR